MSKKTDPYLYKIRNKKTGLFSKGGSYVDDHPRYWSETGKTWKRGPLSNHLSQIFIIPHEWEVVPIIVTVTEVTDKVQSCREFYAPVRARKLKKRAEQEVRRKTEEADRLLREIKDAEEKLARLKQQSGN